MSEFGAYVMHAADVERTAAFYAALGLPLVPEQHGDGPVHHVCQLGSTHLAIFAAATPDGSAVTAPGHREAGGSFTGFAVDDLHAVLERLDGLGSPIVEPLSKRSWGERALVRDPDGRVVELFQRPP